MSEIQLAATALGVCMIASVFLGVSVVAAREMGWRTVGAVWGICGLMVGAICAGVALVGWGTA